MSKFCKDRNIVGASAGFVERVLTSDEVVTKERCQKYFVSCQRCCHHQVSNCYYHILRFLGSIPNLSLLLLCTWMPIEEERGCKPGQRKWVRGLRNIPRGRPSAVRCWSGSLVIFLSIKRYSELMIWTANLLQDLSSQYHIFWTHPWKILTFDIGSEMLIRALSPL